MHTKPRTRELSWTKTTAGSERVPEKHQDRLAPGQFIDDGPKISSRAMRMSLVTPPKDGRLDEQALGQCGVRRTLAIGLQRGAFLLGDVDVVEHLAMPGPAGDGPPVSGSRGSPILMDSMRSTRA
jgi:hypothetical protein